MAPDVSSVAVSSKCDIMLCLICLPTIIFLLFCLYIFYFRKIFIECTEKELKFFIFFFTSLAIGKIHYHCLSAQLEMTECRGALFSLFFSQTYTHTQLYKFFNTFLIFPFSLLFFYFQRGRKFLAYNAL